MLYILEDFVVYTGNTVEPIKWVVSSMVHSIPYEERWWEGEDLFFPTFYTGLLTGGQVKDNWFTY